MSHYNISTPETEYLKSWKNKRPNDQPEPMWVSPYQILLTTHSSGKLGAKPWLHHSQGKQAPDLDLPPKRPYHQKPPLNHLRIPVSPLQTEGNSSEGKHLKTRARLHQNEENPLVEIQDICLFFNL